MNNLIMSTTGTNKRYKIGNVITGTLFILIGIFLLFLYTYGENQGSDSRMSLILLLALFCIIDGLFTIVSKWFFSTSYVDIYSDKFIGKGIQQFNMVDFNLDIAQITNITVDKSFIFINTNSGTYKIISNNETAQKVFEHYNTAKKN